MDNSKIYLASNLKYLRILNKKTQEEVATICNKKNTTISNWEKGIREPDAVDLSILSSFFNVAIDDLMLKDLRIENDIEQKQTMKFGDMEVTLSKNGNITNDDLDEAMAFILEQKLKNKKDRDINNENK